MAEISSAITYTAKFTEKEYRLVAKALALLAGVEAPRVMPEDREAAKALNNRMLEQHGADLLEKLSVAKHKRTKDKS